jgi:hypothetical protein
VSKLKNVSRTSGFLAGCEPWRESLQKHFPRYAHHQFFRACINTDEIFPCNPLLLAPKYLLFRNGVYIAGHCYWSGTKLDRWSVVLPNPPVCASFKAKAVRYLVPGSKLNGTWFTVHFGRSQSMGCPKKMTPRSSLNAAFRHHRLPNRPFFAKNANSLSSMF